MMHQQFLRLVLFDIDGTLISTDGIAKHAFGEAIDELFGQKPGVLSIDFAGKTDQQIYREVCAIAGISEQDSDTMKDRLFDRFFELLESRLNEQNVVVLPGVRELLDAIEAEEASTNALLTGNMLRGARIKLTPPGLLKYFSFGAFGGDAFHRHELPEIAKTRAYDKLGVVFKAKEIVIIGDTPYDIDCGRHMNVRTIAVATGGYSHERLSAEKPDYIFENLSDTEKVLDAIFA